MKDFASFASQHICSVNAACLSVIEAQACSSISFFCSRTRFSCRCPTSYVIKKGKETLH